MAYNIICLIITATSLACNYGKTFSRCCIPFPNPLKSENDMAIDSTVGGSEFTEDIATNHRFRNDVPDQSTDLANFDSARMF